VYAADEQEPMPDEVALTQVVGESTRIEFG
jgi:hypothetical protein